VTDASADRPTGTGGTNAGGCSCAVAETAAPAPAALFAIAGVVLLISRRRSRRAR